jgi:hypothetical protein
MPKQDSSPNEQKDKNKPEYYFPGNEGRSSPPDTPGIRRMPGADAVLPPVAAHRSNASALFRYLFAGEQESNRNEAIRFSSFITLQNL